MRFSNPEEAGKETFQIIRMLEDDLEDGKIVVLRDMDQALTRKSIKHLFRMTLPFTHGKS